MSTRSEYHVLIFIFKQFAWRTNLNSEIHENLYLACSIEISFKIDMIFTILNNFSFDSMLTLLLHVIITYSGKLIIRTNWELACS